MTREIKPCDCLANRPKARNGSGKPRADKSFALITTNANRKHNRKFHHSSKLTSKLQSANAITFCYPTGYFTARQWTISNHCASFQDDQLTPKCGHKPSYSGLSRTRYTNKYGISIITHGFLAADLYMRFVPLRFSSRLFRNFGGQAKRGSNYQEERDSAPSDLPLG